MPITFRASLPPLLLLLLLAFVSSAASWSGLLRTSSPRHVAAPAASRPATGRVPLTAIRLQDGGADGPDAAAAADAAAEADVAAPEQNSESPATDDDAAAEDEDDDLLSSPAFLKQKLKVLEKELEEVLAATEVAKEEASVEGEEWADKRARLQGDFDNFRARHVNQTLEAQNEAKVKLIQDLLPVLDNFDRARQSIAPEGEVQVAVNAEYIALEEQLFATLEGLGLSKIPTVGEEFDYNMHMAIQQVPSADYDEGIVCSEAQPGYTCGGVLVRAAYVMVSSGM